MKTNTFRNFVSALTQVTALVLALICFSIRARANETTAVIGPTPSVENDHVSHGYLVVFTPTQQTQWGENSYYYPHTGYRIVDASGKNVEWVSNRNNRTDENPQKVKLLPGRYTVEALGDKAEVLIELARTTIVHLDK